MLAPPRVVTGHADRPGVLAAVPLTLHLAISQLGGLMNQKSVKADDAVGPAFSRVYGMALRRVGNRQRRGAGLEPTHVGRRLLAGDMLTFLVIPAGYCPKKIRSYGDRSPAVLPVPTRHSPYAAVARAVGNGLEADDLPAAVLMNTPLGGDPRHGGVEFHVRPV